MLQKFLITLASAFLLVSTSVFVSCSDSDDGPEVTTRLKLTSSTAQLKADGTDKATFTVELNGANITTDATIWQLANDAAGKDVQLSAATFTTTVAGTYKFQARYTENGTELVSNVVTVTATTEGAKETYFRRIFVQQLTSVGCINCPLLNKALTNLEQSEEWKDRLVRASFHTNYTVIDPMTVIFTGQYQNFFHQNGLPAFFADFIPDTHVINEQAKIVTQLERVRKDYPAVCGIALESTYNEATREVKFTVKMTATETNEYRVLAFLVEDHIISPQGDIADYEHNNTVRAGFSGSLLGDKLGTVEAGKETTKTYSLTLNSSWKPENMRIVACILNKVGDTVYGNNSATCALNGSSDYKYNEE